MSSNQFSRRLLGFCSEIEPSSKPISLPFTKIDDAPYAAGVCHANVDHAVRTNGGIRVPGWIVWEQPEFIEAEFHSVWQRHVFGELLDVTPRADGELVVTFLPSHRFDVEPRPGGMIIPANRTSIPDMPFIFAGRQTGEFVQVAFDASTMVKLKALGK